MLSRAASLVARAPRAAVPSVSRPAVRALTTTGTFKKRGTAAENEYYRKVEAEEARKFAEQLHDKELKTLLAALGEEQSKLSSEALHRLLEWKHIH